MTAEAKVEELLGAHFAQQDGGPQEVELFRYAANDMTAEERQAFAQNLTDNSTKRALLAFDEVADIWDEAPAERERSWLATLLRPRFVGIAAAVATCGVVLALALPQLPFWGSQPLRAKGGFQLHMAVERSGKTFRFFNGDQLKNGDRVGFFYSGPENAYLAVLYGDSEGNFVQLFPAQANNSAEIEPGSEIRLPDGAVISPGQGCEWVVGVFSSDAKQRDELQQTLQKMWQNKQGCRLNHPGNASSQFSVLEISR